VNENVAIILLIIGDYVYSAMFEVGLRESAIIVNCVLSFTCNVA